MAVEIEIKARLDDFAPVKERLSEWGEYYRSYTKSDVYWLPGQANDGIPSGVRIRRDRGIDADGAASEVVLVTYKTKEIFDGVEVNDESEFTVSDAVPFEALLLNLGLREAIRKEKQGWAWNIEGQPPILAELSLVTGLGWFLEIEIQAANNQRQTVEESRRRLLAALEKLEIPPERIEPRPYTVMLREKGVR